MTLTVAVVDAIRADLAAVPPKDERAREVTRLEAISRMRGEVMTLRERGYTWQEVAEMVSSKGCRVTAATLRTELSRKATVSKPKVRDRRASGSGAQDPNRGAKPAGGEKATPAAKDSPAAARPNPELKKEGPTQAKPVPDVKPGGFVVREDSEI
ncbi:MAG TPA: hypothetical protein VH853_20280 [Polyangia bacterium]|jgi:hypothetical protein|nr:hypothetical protein [Polyangia bacterium]